MSTSTTSTTTDATGSVPRPTTVGPTTGRRSGAGVVTAAGQTARRTVLQFFRTPQLIVMGSIQGAMFLFMFRYIFGGAIAAGGGVSYVDFLVPGFLVTTVLWMGMSAAAGVAEDSASGLYDRLRSLPIPRSAVMLGRSLADTALIGWGLLVTGVLGFAVGFRTHGSLAEVLFSIGLIVVYGFAVSWVFIFIGLAAKNAQAAQGLSMLVIPFSFISSANVPITSMPGWMQPFAANQPITVMINAGRSLMAGGTAVVGIAHTTTYWVVLSLIWCVVIVAVFGAFSVRRFARTR